MATVCKIDTAPVCKIDTAPVSVTTGPTPRRVEEMVSYSFWDRKTQQMLTRIVGWDIYSVFDDGTRIHLGFKKFVIEN